MKLYMKQKVFSWRDRFAIKDEQECDRWFAKGKIFTLGRKLYVYDSQEREVAFIRQKLITFLPRYFIEIGDDVFAVVKELTLLKPRYRIEGTNWVVKGDFLAHEYEITSGRKGEMPVMSLSKRWIAWGDTYELDIPRPENELLALCVALAIDCINADAVRSASANSTTTSD